MVGDRLVTVNSGMVEVRYVYNGQMMHRIRKVDGNMRCMSPVVGHNEFVITGGSDGDIHLWDIEKGKRVLRIHV